MSRGPMPQGKSTKRVAPPVAAPDCPGWLDAEAKTEWERIAPELLAAGLLARVDRAALAAYCQAWAELVESTRVLQAEGRYLVEPVQNAKGEILGEKQKAHPALAAQRDAFARVRAYLAEFGLTPAARARLRLAEESGAEDLMAFLRGPTPTE